MNLCTYYNINYSKIILNKERIDKDYTFFKFSSFLVTMFIMSKSIVYLCSCCDLLPLAEFILVCVHTLILIDTNIYLYYRYDLLWMACVLNKGVSEKDYTFSKALRILVTTFIQTEIIIRLYPCCDYLFLANFFRSIGYVMILYEIMLYLDYRCDLRLAQNFSNPDLYELFEDM